MRLPWTKAFVGDVGSAGNEAEGGNDAALSWAWIKLAVENKQVELKATGEANYYSYWFTSSGNR